MRFGEVIEHARNGKKIARHGWNGKGMYVYMTKGRLVPTDEWLATQTDMLAFDWYVVDEEDE